MKEIIKYGSKADSVKHAVVCSLIALEGDSA